MEEGKRKLRTTREEQDEKNVEDDVEEEKQKTID